MKKSSNERTEERRKRGLKGGCDLSVLLYQIRLANAREDDAGEEGLFREDRRKVKEYLYRATDECCYTGERRERRKVLKKTDKHSSS